MNLASKRVVFVCGSGGVGKTTIACSLGIFYAHQGKKVALLTVDPAKRLAQALGLNALSSELSLVESGGEGKLYASMLDAKRYFDTLVQRLSQTTEQREKILRNPLYQHMVNFFGGTQEYAAMEQVFDLYAKQQFDLIVVDTPPTQNALDLLGAPQKLVDFFDAGVFKWFEGSGGRFSKWLHPGTQAIIQVFQKLFGETFWGEFTRFMSDLSSLRKGFVERHGQIHNLFKAPDTAFLLVLGATSTQWQESFQFKERLSEMGVFLNSFIVNRLFSPVHRENPSSAELEFISFYAKLVRAQQVSLSLIKKEAGTTPVIPTPMTDNPPYERASLLELGEILYNESHEKRQWSRFLSEGS